MNLEESHKQREENVDKELLFEYMEKLERKEREREQKKEQRRLKRQGKNAKQGDINNLQANPHDIAGVTTALIATNCEGQTNRRTSPVPLAANPRPNETRPISIVKPMIEGRPVMSTSSAGRAAGENGAGHVADTKRFNSDSACPISVHVVDAQVSTDDEPSSFKRRGSNENGGAKLSRMNSMPINSRNRDSDRESDQGSVFSSVSARGSNYSVVVLSRGESEDKGTQTLECRVNEANPPAGREDETPSATGRPLRSPGLNSRNSSIIAHEFSLPSLEETKDDIESDISENDNLPYSPLIYPTTKSTSSRGAPPMLERSNTSPHVHRPGMLVHQATHQRRTLMGLKRQQRVEEAANVSDDEPSMGSEGVEGGSGEDGVVTTESPEKGPTHDPINGHSVSPSQFGFDSNPNLERSAIGSDYQPITKRGAIPCRYERHSISRSNTVSVRRMDSLEVPSFHPLGRRLRRKKMGSGPNKADSRKPESGNLSLSMALSGKSKRHQYATNNPSLSCDVTTPSIRDHVTTTPFSVSIDTDDNLYAPAASTSGSRFLDPSDYCGNRQGGSSCSSIYLEVSPPDFMRSHPRSRVPKQVSEDSQHSVTLQLRPSGESNQGDDITPDEHLSSPEITRRRSHWEQLTPASVRSKFKVDPRSDLPKLHRAPTITIDHDVSSHIESPRSPTTHGISPRKKLYVSDSHLNSNQQSKATQVSPHSMQATSRKTNQTNANQSSSFESPSLPPTFGQLTDAPFTQSEVHDFNLQQNFGGRNQSTNLPNHECSNSEC
ncbi:uncharacterized protein LOC134842193 isoform X2 [Symsagittifera roscoffensis]|uniref:uncharacterized protein LOC134842193 isoform X2 n=1 Tax=Symsagittifera roscoffensis TaxID=84072 RepID=UPI00307C21FE